MLQTITERATVDGKPGNETDSTIEGVRWIAINVLGAVGYGTQQSWGHQSTEAPPGYRLVYMDAILAIVENLVPSVFVPLGMLTSPIMPESVRRVGYAVQEYPGHVKDLLDAERKAERPAQANILSTLVTASDAETKTKSKLFLSESELAGNLFQFTIAGFDTTANTMAYAITILAIHPEWQDWICEEIDEVVAEKGLQYEKAFPDLKRCLALMVRTATKSMNPANSDNLRSSSRPSDSTHQSHISRAPRKRPSKSQHHRLPSKSQQMLRSTSLLPPCTPIQLYGDPTSLNSALQDGCSQTARSFSHRGSRIFHGLEAQGSALA